MVPITNFPFSTCKLRTALHACRAPGLLAFSFLKREKKKNQLMIWKEKEICVILKNLVARLQKSLANCGRKRVKKSQKKNKEIRLSILCFSFSLSDFFLNFLFFFSKKVVPGSKCIIFNFQSDLLPIKKRG